VPVVVASATRESNRSDRCHSRSVRVRRAG
jgi:hypothetical protein